MYGEFACQSWRLQGCLGQSQIFPLCTWTSFDTWLGRKRFLVLEVCVLPTRRGNLSFILLNTKQRLAIFEFGTEIYALCSKDNFAPKTCKDCDCTTSIHKSWEKGAIKILTRIQTLQHCIRYLDQKGSESCVIRLYRLFLRLEFLASIAIESRNKR